MTLDKVYDDLLIILSRVVQVDPNAPRSYRDNVISLMNGFELPLACEELYSCFADSDAAIRLRYDDLVHLLVLINYFESIDFPMDQAFRLALPEIYRKPLGSRDDVIDDLLTEIVRLIAIDPEQTATYREEIFGLVEAGELALACDRFLRLFRDDKICFDFEDLAHLFEILDFLLMRPFDKAAYLRPDGSGFYDSRQSPGDEMRENTGA